MGGKITELDNGTVREIDTEKGGRGTGGESKSTTDTKASGTGRGTGGGTDTASASGTAEKGNTVSKADELSVLTDEERTLYATANETEKKRILKNAKRRQRYAEQKQAKGQSVKPRKVNGTKNTNTVNAFDVTQLNLIFAGLSGAIASRPNCSHWLLTPEEINSITVPLSKMLAESETFAGMGQYSNQIALVMACLTVFGPRLFITVQQSKEAKQIERTGQHTDTNYRERKSRDSRKTKESDRKPDNGSIRDSSSHNSNDDKNIPFYGVPIA